MYLTEEQLKNIEDLAYKLFEPDLIAVALDVDSDELKEDLQDNKSEVFRAYFRGFLRQLDEVRTDTIKAARNGSNPAQMELLKQVITLQKQLIYG